MKPFRSGVVRHSLLLGLGLAGPVTATHADVLYDSRAMVANGSYTSVKFSMISGMGLFGVTLDQQASDDFNLTSPTTLTSVTADFYHFGALSSPSGGWLVEVFPDVGGKPSETPAKAVTTSNFTRLGSFAQGLIDLSPNTPENRSAFQINLTGLGVTLGAGTWWMSVVAVDESAFGDVYLQVGLNQVLQGNVAHARAGGPAHGNFYPTAEGEYYPWTPMTTSEPDTNSRPYELSMRIEGSIPTPAVATLFMGAGLARGLRRKR